MDKSGGRKKWSHTNPPKKCSTELGRLPAQPSSLFPVLWMNQISVCCAECGEEGGGNLKTCKRCMLVKYCNASCQHKHWPKHKILCKERAAELRDEALFKDPPPKEECPICFLPMPASLITCITLPDATITSVPMQDFAVAYEDMAKMDSEQYYPCCRKTICKGCEYSFIEFEKDGKCPFCNSDRGGKRGQEAEELSNRMRANDPASICLLAAHYNQGLGGVEQDQTKAMELYARAADLGNSKAHFFWGRYYHTGGDSKKAKFHYEAAAMAGHEIARSNLGAVEYDSGNKERGVKH